MAREEEKKLVTTVQPHLSSGRTTALIMWTVSLCLLPAWLWGAVMFGPYALLVVAVSIASAALTELAAGALRGKMTLGDGSAVLTGLLIGLCLPPPVPLYVPICAAVFALAVVKHAFGGLGANWLNPAMTGWVFALLCFPSAMNTWTRPAAFPAEQAAGVLSGTTPLGAVKLSLAELAAQAPGPAGLEAVLKGLEGPMPLLASINYPISLFDTHVTGWLNGVFGFRIPKGYFDLFFGNTAGAIGAVSVFLLLIGAAVLFIRKIISWEIPAAFLGSFALMMWAFGGIPFAAGLFRGDVVFQLCTGSVVLGAFFLATDSVTAPLTRPGKIIFGLGVGLFTFFIRFAGSLSDGVAVAILVMNMFVPLIDRCVKLRPVRVAPGKTA